MPTSMEGRKPMTQSIREAHYTVPVGLLPRNQFDPGISDVNTIDNAVNLDLIGATAPAFPNSKLVSSAFGSIDRILFTLPDYALNPSYITVYEDLFASLPQSTRIVILCSAKTRLAVDDLLRNAGVLDRSEIGETNYDIRFSIWAEDAYVVVQRNGQGVPTLVEPANFTRYDDGFIADILSAQTDLGVHSVPLYFQGGNILIGDDYWIIGADYPTKALQLGLIQANAGESSRDAVIRRYGEELDTSRKMIVLGTRNTVPQTKGESILVEGEAWTEILYFGTGVHQPLFHIDMFITLAGRDDSGLPVALVGDPRMAAEILGEQTTPEMLIPYYDDVASRLGNEGFRVVRNPLPLTYADFSNDKRRIWYFATANNALVEVAGGRKRVWLPTYGYGSQQHLRATDSRNKRIWEDLGFEVDLLGDFNPFASNLGAVHCICKFLQRG